MKIIILGAGKITKKLCSILEPFNYDIFLIDQNAELVDELINKYDLNYIVGNGASVEILKASGISDCDVFLALTGNDELNILSGTLARRLGAKSTVIRVENADYIDQTSEMKRIFGFSEILNPDMIAATNIIRMLKYPKATMVENLIGNRVALVGLEVKGETFLDGLNLIELRKMFHSVLVCVIEREGRVIIPSGSSVLKEGDYIYVSGIPEDLTIFYRTATDNKHGSTSILIVGGGRITENLLKYLQKNKFKAKVIESKMETCQYLSGKFPFAEIVCGDGNSTDFLDEQDLTSYDAFVALTGGDGENLISSIYAKEEGVFQVITKLNNQKLLKLVEKERIKNFLVFTNLIAHKLKAFIIAKENAHGSNVESLYRIANDRVEILEFIAKGDCPIIGTPIRNLSLKKNLLVAYVLRKDQLIFVKGDDVIDAGDKVVVITVDNNLSDLNDILEF